jgi:hypothetical protein
MISPMPPILVLCRDLMFVSKITATAAALGVPIQLVRDLSKFPQETDSQRMIVDLNQEGFLKAAAEWKRRTGGRVIGFASHVDSDTIARAKSEQLDEVLPRSAFVTRLDQILAHPA